MPKRLLEVGNCAADHRALSTLVERAFGAEIVRAHTAAEALASLRDGDFDLVVVNRVFDFDGDEGLALIRDVKSNPSLAAVPLMLITNYADHAQSAVNLGAVPGFGKRDLNLPATREKLGEFLKSEVQG